MNLKSFWRERVVPLSPFIVLAAAAAVAAFHILFYW